MTLNIGATCLPGGGRFRLWAPLARSAEIEIVSPNRRIIRLTRQDEKYFETTIDGLPPGSLCYYRLDGRVKLPDPASRCQPQGVHGPSQVIDNTFTGSDAVWRGRGMAILVLLPFT